MELDSQENKALVWGILAEQHVFDNIPDKLFGKVQTLFETEISSLKSRSSGKNNDLLILNKLLMQNFTRSIATLKDNKSAKAKQVEESFNLKRTELNTLLNGNKPQEIDFSDPIDDEPLKIEDLDNRLNSIIDERKTLVSEYESIEIKADNSLEKSEIEIKDLPKEIPNELENVTSRLNEEIIEEENLEETFLNKLKRVEEVNLETLDKKLDDILGKIEKLLNFGIQNQF
jgi:hypothetical protein